MHKILLSYIAYRFSVKTLSFVCLLSAALSVQALPERQDLPTWESVNYNMARYCYECHGGFLTEGNVNLLANKEEASLQANPELWESVLASLRNHYMPHEDGRIMPKHARDTLLKGIDGRMVVLSENKQPSSVALRRLNRTQLANTLKILFFIDEDLAEDLPPDDSGYGFDTTADVLTVSPLLLEKYLEVAARAGDLACPSPRETRTHYLRGQEFDSRKAYPSEEGLRIVSGGEEHSASTILHLQPGEYALNFLLSADQAGDEPAQASITINDKPLGTVTVEAHAGKDSPETFTYRIRVTPRDTAREASLPVFTPPLKISVFFDNDYYQPKADERKPQDRNLVLVGLEYIGPENQTADELGTPFIQYYFGGDLDSLNPTQIRTGIFRFASNAYRRPATDALMGSLWRVYQENLNEDQTNRPAAIRAVIDAVIASPHFLFRQEPDRAGDPFVLASWLSYLLWSSPPDERLYKLARKGELYNQLDEEIDRMLTDPKAQALSTDFAAQWLQFRDVNVHKASRKAYPAYNEALKRAMLEETEYFMLDIIQNDRSLLRILDADYTFADKRLAEYYNLKEKPDEGFQKVSLANTPRRGVWSQASTLMITSHGNSTSPVLRGKWMLENLLGLSPPPPPNNVPSLKQEKDTPTPDSLRASLVEHRDNPDCRSCHAIMDPFGLAMETYNGIGQWRTEEELGQVQPETLFDGTVIESPVQFARYLVEQHRESFIHTAAEKMTIYATGRGTTWRDRAALQSITDATRQQDYRFSALVKAVIHEYAPGIPDLPSTSDMAYND